MRQSVLALMLLLGACATWTKPGGTAAALDTDETACAGAAARQFPPRLAPTPEAMPFTGPQRCTPLYCTDVGRALSGPPTVADLNALPRSDALAACMAARGWRRSWGVPALTNPA